MTRPESAESGSPHVVCPHDPVCHRREDGWPECGAPRTGSTSSAPTRACYLLGVGPLPSDDIAKEAAQQLAEKAHKVLHAGLRPEDVEAAWSRVIVCGGDE